MKVLIGLGLMVLCVGSRSGVAADPRPRPVLFCTCSGTEAGVQRRESPADEYGSMGVEFDGPDYLIQIASYGVGRLVYLAKDKRTGSVFQSSVPGNLIGNGSHFYLYSGEDLSAVVFCRVSIRSGS